MPVDSLQHVAPKTTTTVAFDFGRVAFTDPHPFELLLFGTPGQQWCEFPVSDVRPTRAHRRSFIAVQGRPAPDRMPQAGSSTVCESVRVSAPPAAIRPTSTARTP